jgi:hypothetical protein
MYGRAQAASLRVLVVTGLVAVTSFTSSIAISAAPSPKTPPAQSARIEESYGALPLIFEANTGQTNQSVKFLARGGGYGLYLKGNEAVLMLRKSVSGAGRTGIQRKPVRGMETAPSATLRMQLAGASSGTEPLGEEMLPGKVNYLIGNDPSRWRTGVPTYARVRYRSIYPGIDLVYYGNHQQLEYDFVAAPGADPRVIQMRLDGAASIHRASNGNLEVSTGDGALTLRKPVIYQVVDGRRIPVAGEFTLAGKQTVGFRLGRYERSKPLVIDPVLVYSTFLSGSGDAKEALAGDAAGAIAIDSQGSVYVAGATVSTDFPVTPGAFQTIDPGGASSPASTIFVSKLNAEGTALIYSTYLGGNGGDGVSAIAVDAAGDVYLTGATASQNFPVTSGVLQTVNKATVGSKITAFVSELNPTGTHLVYSTYLGGSIIDGAAAIAVDAAGDAYVAGQTSSPDFPVTQGAYQITNKSTSMLYSNAFVAKLNSGGTALLYSTFLGGSGGTRMIEGGCISAAGRNGMMGYPVGDNEDAAFAIAVDGAGDAYIAGQALSTDFPVTQGAFQPQNNGANGNATNAFVAKLNPSGSELLYSTYLGGSGTSCDASNSIGNDGDSAGALAVDSSGDAYIAGVAFSLDFPVTPGAFQTTNRYAYKPSGVTAHIAGPTAFVAKLNPTGSALVYSTYLGGSGGFINATPFFEQIGGDGATGLAVDSAGDAYVTGATASLDFPVTAGAFQTTNAGATGSGGSLFNAFVTELNPSGSGLLYSTYLGGNGANPNSESSMHLIPIGDGAGAMALDGSGNVYIAGQVESADFPVTSGAFQTVIPAATSAFITKLGLAPEFAITGTAVTVTAGATTGNTSTITVTPFGGFTGSVTLTADLTSQPAGAVNLPTFSFGSTSPVNITGASGETALLTITTSAAGGCAAKNKSELKTPWYVPGGATLAVLMLFNLPRRRGWRASLGWMLLLVCLSWGVSACGSSSSGSCNAITAPTTSGTYTITVTGTSSGAPAASGTVTLNVQ